MILIKILIPASSSDLCIILGGQVLINQRIFDHCSIIKLPPAIFYFWVEFAQLMETVRVKQLGRTDQWERSKPVTWSELTPVCQYKPQQSRAHKKWRCWQKVALIKNWQARVFLALSHYFEDKTHWVHSLFYKQRSPSKYFHCRKYFFCCQNIFLCRGVTVIQVLGPDRPELAEN